MLQAAAGNHAAFAEPFQSHDAGVRLHDSVPPRHQPALKSDFEATTHFPQVGGQSQYALVPAAGDMVAQSWHAVPIASSVRHNSACVVECQSSGPAHVASHPWHSSPQLHLQQLYQWQHAQPLQPQHGEKPGGMRDCFAVHPIRSDEAFSASAHGDDSTGGNVLSGHDYALGQPWALNGMINLSSPSRAGAGAAAHGARPTGSGFMCLPFGGAPGLAAPAANGLTKLNICPSDPDAAAPRDLTPRELHAACSPAQDAQGAGEPDAGFAPIGVDMTSFRHAAVVHHADCAIPAGIPHPQVQQQRQYGKQRVEQLGHADTSSEPRVLNSGPSLPAGLQYELVQHPGLQDGEQFKRKPGGEHFQLQMYSAAYTVTQLPQLPQQQEQPWGPCNAQKGSWDYSSNGTYPNTSTTQPPPPPPVIAIPRFTAVSPAEDNYMPDAFDPIVPMPCGAQLPAPSLLPPLPATREGASSPQPTSRLADAAASGAVSPFGMDTLYGLGSPAALDLGAAVDGSPFMLSPLLRHQQDDTGDLAGWLASPPLASNRFCMRDAAAGGAGAECAIGGPCPTLSSGGLIGALASSIKLGDTTAAAGVLSGVNPPCSEIGYLLLLRKDGVEAGEEGTTTATAPAAVTAAAEPVERLLVGAGGVEEGASANLPHFGSCLMTTHEEELAGLSSPGALHLHGCPWAGLGLGSPAGSLEPLQMMPLFLSSPPPSLDPNQEGAGTDYPGRAGLAGVARFCTDKAAAPDAVFTQMTCGSVDPSTTDPTAAADVIEATEDQPRSPQRRVSQRIRKSTTRAGKDTSYLYAAVPGDSGWRGGPALGRGGGERGTRRRVARREAPAKSQKDDQSNDDQKQSKDVLLSSHANTVIQQEQEALTGPQLAPKDKADDSQDKTTIAKPDVNLAPEAATADAVNKVVEATAPYIQIAGTEAVATGAAESAAQVPREEREDPPAARVLGSHGDSQVDFTCPLDPSLMVCQLEISRADGDPAGDGSLGGALENAATIACAATSNTATTAADIRMAAPADAGRDEDRPAAAAHLHVALEATPTIAALWPVAESTAAAVIAPTRRYGHRARARKLQLKLNIANMTAGSQDVPGITAATSEGLQADLVPQPAPLSQQPQPEIKMERDTAAPRKCGPQNLEADGFQGLCDVTQHTATRRMQRSGPEMAAVSGVSMAASGGRGAWTDPVASGAGAHALDETLIDVSPRVTAASVEIGAEGALLGGRVNIFAADASAVCTLADEGEGVTPKGGPGSSIPSSAMAPQSAMNPAVVGRRSAQRRYVRWSDEDNRCEDSAVAQKDTPPKLLPVGASVCQELEAPGRSVLVEPPIIAPMGLPPPSAPLPSAAQQDPEPLSPGTSRPDVETAMQGDSMAVGLPESPEPLLRPDTTDKTKASPVPTAATEPATLPEAIEATGQRPKRTASRDLESGTLASLSLPGHVCYNVRTRLATGPKGDPDGGMATSGATAHRRHLRAGVPPTKNPVRDKVGNKNPAQGEQQVDLKEQQQPLLDVPQLRRESQTQAQTTTPLLLSQPPQPQPQPQPQRQSVPHARPQPRPHPKPRLPHKKRLYEWDLEQELTREALESRPTTVRAPDSGPGGAAPCSSAMRAPHGPAPLPPAVAPRRKESSNAIDASDRISNLMGRLHGTQREANSGYGQTFGKTEGADGQRQASQDAAGLDPLQEQPLEQFPLALAAIDGNLDREVARVEDQRVEPVPPASGELPDKESVAQQSRASTDDLLTQVNRSDGLGAVICRQTEPPQAAQAQFDDGVGVIGSDVVGVDAQNDKPESGSRPGAVITFTEPVSLSPTGLGPCSAASIVLKQESGRPNLEKGSLRRRLRAGGSGIAGGAVKDEQTINDPGSGTTTNLSDVRALGAGRPIVPQRAAALRAVAAITASNGATGPSSGGAGSRSPKGIGNTSGDQRAHVRRRLHDTEGDLTAPPGKEDRCKRRKPAQRTSTLAPITRRAAVAAVAASASAAPKLAVAAPAFGQHRKRLHRGDRTEEGPQMGETFANLAAADLRSGEAAVQGHAGLGGTGDLQVTGNPVRLDGTSDEDVPGSLAMADAAATLRLLGRKRGAVGKPSGPDKDEQQQGRARSTKRTRRQQGDAQPGRSPATVADAKPRSRTATTTLLDSRGQRRGVRGPGEGSGLKLPTRVSNRELTKAETNDKAAAAGTSTGAAQEVATDQRAIGIKQNSTGETAAMDANLGASDVQEVAAGSRAAAAVAAAAAAAAAAARVTGGAGSPSQPRGVAVKKRGKRLPGQIPNVLAAAASILLSMQPGVKMYEKSFRQELGNNPDTSKALRLLREQGYVERTGGGFRCDPYGYTVTTAGLKAAEEQRRREHAADQAQGQL